MRFQLSFLLFLCALVVTANARTDVLVPRRSSWKYLADGSDPGAAWRGSWYNDSTWNTGGGKLGYGATSPNTVVGSGANPITVFFRKAIDIADPAQLQAIALKLTRNDGVAVYINGTEVFRANLSAGAAFNIPATADVADQTDTITTLSPALFVPGRNVIAVEVHRSSLSADLCFDAALTATIPAAGNGSLIRGPYLQNATPGSIVVRWRTADSHIGRVRYGTDPAALTSVAADTTATTEHQIKLSGLAPNSTYFYAIDKGTTLLAGGDNDYSFRTLAPASTSAPLRIWALGDCGTGGMAGQDAERVRNGYVNSSYFRQTDVWLMLGDNAYDSGFDNEYQRAVFDTYPNQLRNTTLWSTIGNHETNQSTNPNPSTPYAYYQNFTFPKNGEAGGLASSTPQYYSFDTANVHFVCLDSMTSIRKPTRTSPPWGAPMLDWLENDLAATSQKWIIAYWHHPPYTKGSHNSDTETDISEMRKYVLPILESYGVDLVLSGHSHSFERSYLLNGHYGLSSTLTADMKVDPRSGRDDEAYQRATPGRGAVYVVAGTSGKTSSWTGGSTAESNPTPHPAMYISLLRLGSMVIDVSGDQLDARMIDDRGQIADYFSIRK